MKALTTLGTHGLQSVLPHGHVLQAWRLVDVSAALSAGGTDDGASGGAFDSLPQPDSSATSSTFAQSRALPLTRFFVSMNGFLDKSRRYRRVFHGWR